MDFGILIFLFLVGIWTAPVASLASAASKVDSVVGRTQKSDSGSIDSAQRVKTLKTPVATALPVRLRHSEKQPPGLADSTPAWQVPDRDGAAGGALREAFRKGQSQAPWSRVFEFDGMWEEWTPWPSLPWTERAERISWTGPSLAGTSDAGPLTVAVAKATELGWGGVPVRRILSAPSPVDTPRTELQFWRGALASYRFGLDFSRAVAGPWGVALRMETRSAQGRAWVYRDQIQDMFQGSLGRLREELPAAGRSPGQDDVQWEAVISRATPDLLFEAGWNWVDLQRGIPNPFKVWGGPDLAVLPGRESRSGAFGRLLGQTGEFFGSLSGRQVTQNWTRATWGDSIAPLSVSGNVQHQEFEAEGSWGGELFRGGVRTRAALRTGTTSTPQAFQEDQERLAGFLGGRWESLWGSLEAGWNRLNDISNRSLLGVDGSLGLNWEGAYSGDLQVARQLRLPDWESSVLPDPLLQSLPTLGLGTEARWVAQTHQRIAVRPWLALDAGAAGLVIDQAIEPRYVPTTNDRRVLPRTKLRLTNATGSVLGWSAQFGLRVATGSWWLGSQAAIGQTMAPGESWGGSRDLRYPVLHTRTTLGWEGTLLVGRVGAASTVSLQTWSSSQHLAGFDDGNAGLVRSPPGATLDWENRLQIKTFGIFWRLENLLNDRQVPAAGWTPPGIRSGWGITWNFGG